MLQKCNLWNVSSVFFDEPTRWFELLLISRKINLAHTSVKKHLESLMGMQIIEKKKGPGKNFYYVAKNNSSEFIHYKKIYNLEILKNSNLIKFITEKLFPNSIVLFGSFSRGEDTQESDIDLFVESGIKDIDLSKFEKKLNRKIELHFKDNFKEYSSELKNNIMNGVTLYGFLEGY